MIKLDGISLTVEDVVRVAIHNEKVALSESGKDNVLRSRNDLERLVSSGKTIYGINTGFGNLMDIRIHDEDLLKLQENLIRSHSSGVGEPLPIEEVRAMMLVRANSLVKGFSGVTLQLIESILAFLNTGITPVVPRYGSVGASGDLAPLAHVALCIMGESDVYYKGEKMSTGKAMKMIGIKSHTFREKEGVAFINGTSSISGLLALSIQKRAFSAYRSPQKLLFRIHKCPRQGAWDSWSYLKSVTVSYGSSPRQPAIQRSWSQGKARSRLLLIRFS